MEPGDPLLIYRNSESRYMATGHVGPMTHTEYFRDEYWVGGPALDIYVVEAYDGSIDVKSETVNELLRYKESFRPQGLMKVADNHPTEQVITRFEI